MIENNVIIFGGSITCWGVIQGLKDRNLNISVVSSGASPIGASSRHVQRHYILDKNATDYLTKIKEIIHAVGGKPILIVAGDDHALEKLSENFEDLVAISTPTFMPWQTLGQVIDKATLAKAAEEIGIKAIPTTVIRNRDEFLNWRNSGEEAYVNGYFLKCQDSVTFKNIYGTKGVICRSREDVIEAYDKYEGFLGGLLLQKYLVGELDQLVAVLMVLDGNNDIVDYNVQKKVRAGGRNFGSTSVSVTVLDEQLLNEARRLVKYLKCVGPVGVQFKFDEGDQDYKIMEINARFSVGVSLAVGAGDNLPFCLFQNVNGVRWSLNPNKAEGVYLWNPLTDLTFILSKRFFQNFLDNLSFIFKPKLIVPLDYKDFRPFKVQLISIFKAVLKRLSG